LTIPFIERGYPTSRVLLWQMSTSVPIGISAREQPLVLKALRVGFELVLRRPMETAVLAEMDS
jgi:hypothetical protein